VKDTFIWPHGPDKLNEFLNHLNSVHQCIPFTMETKRRCHLPFLDIDIYRRPHSSLGHRMYKYYKPTCTNLYLNARSQHHSPNKQAVLSTLVHRVKALCDKDSLHADFVFLRYDFRHNSYEDRQIHIVLNHHSNISKLDNKPSSVAFLQYDGPIFN
jgi:hypothetical protein